MYISFLRFFFHFRLLEDIKYISLCCGPYCLSMYSSLYLLIPIPNLSLPYFLLLES